MDREHRYDIAISIMHTARLSNNINSTYANHDANRQVQNFTRLDNDVGMTICVSRLGVLSDKPIGWTTSKTTSHRNTWCCSTRYLIKLATVLFSDRFFTVVIELGHQYECLDQPKLWCKLPLTRRVKGKMYLFAIWMISEVLWWRWSS